MSVAAESSCRASHPPHQRGWGRWPCPVCGQPLRRELVAPDALACCGRLHSDDQLACTGADCRFSALGNFVARVVATRGIYSVCTGCGGRGHKGPEPCRDCSGRGLVAAGRGISRKPRTNP